ncbi:MAG TPA: alpha/beta hydrolase [Actinomycetota bacterium]|nr:alpha/beta hydrolase [Actinomycetota bacterium]
MTVTPSPSARRRRAFRRLVLLLCAIGMIAGTVAVPAQGAGIDIKRNVAYVDDGNPHHVMDVYIPSGKGPFEGVVVIHGGDWAQGNPRKMAHEATVLAQNGFVAFSVTYRLAPEFTFPAQLEDMQNAVKFIRAHASEFKVKPKQIGALGGSAGGQLAAMLAVSGTGPGDTGGRVNVAVSWSGPLDFTSLRVIIGQRRNRGGQGIARYLGCEIDQCPDTYKVASPIHNVDPTDAPMFIGNSTEEKVSLPNAQSMADTLTEDDVPVELCVVDGKFHSVAMEDQPCQGQGDETVFDASMAFLKKWRNGNPNAAAIPTSPGHTDTVPPPDEPPGTNLALLVVIILVVLIALGTLGSALLRRRRYGGRIR